MVEDEFEEGEFFACLVRLGRDMGEVGGREEGWSEEREGLGRVEQREFVQELEAHEVSF